MSTQTQTMVETRTVSTWDDQVQLQVNVFGVDRQAA
jgi:hypothetical protein